MVIELEELKNKKRKNYFSGTQLKNIKKAHQTFIDEKIWQANQEDKQRTTYEFRQEKDIIKTIVQRSYQKKGYTAVIKQNTLFLDWEI